MLWCCWLRHLLVIWSGGTPSASRDVRAIAAGLVVAVVLAMRARAVLAAVVDLFFGHATDKDFQFRAWREQGKQGASMSTTILLRQLGVGQKARIASVTAQGELGRRIRDMGLIPGAEVEVVGRAPLKDPVALRLLGFTLSLRNNEADHITVESL